ncbi:MAG: Smr/MutS family protein [Bacteroidota bacterium]|nr:Smr/MutS family protein [Bacteroidota bacterium]
MDIEQKIGFDVVRKKLSRFVLSNLGKSVIETMKFTSKFEYLDNELTAVEEFKEIIEKKNFPTEYFYDVRDILESIKSVENIYLNPPEILQIWNSLLTLKNILSFFKNEENRENFPILTQKSKKVNFFDFIADSIKQFLTKEGEIKDNATKELKNIRSEISSKERQVSGLVKKIYAEIQKTGVLDDETNITVRNGKMLIPVDASLKNKIAGIVQDYSSSGKTVYIEPIKSVELNNEINELKFEEKREIIKILINFTNSIKPYTNDLISNYDFMAEMDFIRAKALFANELNALKPKLSKTPTISIRNGFHPLLIWTYKNTAKKVIPLDIDLTPENRIVLISGPNAGGKSIAIKTVGLFQYMLQCGLHIPVQETSIFSFFNNISVDIGDDQSIESDLSTYSSHLTNMKNIINNSDEKTLVLIDEFGTGTDPAMGGAIAESILEELLEMNIWGVINTHYSNLKHFATQKKGIINAAMLFDKKNLKPQYTLELGRPGSSFAFEISQNIGLSNKIINKAKEKAGKNTVNFDKIIAEIEQQAKQIRNDKQEISRLKSELNKKVTDYRDIRENLLNQKKKIITEAEIRAKEILSDANKSVEKTIKEIKLKKADKEATKNIRKEFEKEKEKIRNKIDKIQRINTREEEYLENKKEKKKIVKISGKIEIGDTVFAKKKGIKGKVEEIKDKKALIIMGNIKTHVKLSELEKLGSETKSKAKNKVKVNVKLNETKKDDFVFGLDLRGKRGEEALNRTSKYIDSAIMGNANEVKILHGTGNGILRNLIRDYLKTVNEIEWFGDEDIRLGGAGITIVKFK